MADDAASAAEEPEEPAEDLQDLKWAAEEAAEQHAEAEQAHADSAAKLDDLKDQHADALADGDHEAVAELEAQVEEHEEAHEGQTAYLAHAESQLEEAKQQVDDHPDNEEEEEEGPKDGGVSADMMTLGVEEKPRWIIVGVPQDYVRVQVTKDINVGTRRWEAVVEGREWVILTAASAPEEQEGLLKPAPDKDKIIKVVQTLERDAADKVLSVFCCFQAASITVHTPALPLAQPCTG